MGEAAAVSGERAGEGHSDSAIGESAGGLGIGTALKPVSGGSYPVPAAGSTTRFAATNVEQLEDSPILTGLYFHEYPLAPTIKPSTISMWPQTSRRMRICGLSFWPSLANLVREASTLYASHHYNEYHFLLTLSDVAGGEGLEHGQSSDNGVGEKGFADDAHQLPNSDLLSHEFTHSWNGKYRRPAGCISRTLRLRSRARCCGFTRA